MNCKGLTPKEQESRFQEALDHWITYSDKASWDEVCTRIYEACKAIAISILNSHQSWSPNFDDCVMNATLYYIDYIKRYYKDKIKGDDYPRPRKLSSWLYLGVKGALYNRNLQRIDQEISYEHYLEYLEVRPKEEVRGIYRRELDV